MMKRNCMFCGMVFAITAMSNASAVQEATQRKKPDIVAVLCDDMGYSAPGCFGGEIETPNLDKLASSWMRFSQFYNCAKCVSTRASLMSAKYPQRFGAYLNTELQKVDSSKKKSGRGCWTRRLRQQP